MSLRNHLPILVGILALTTVTTQAQTQAAMASSARTQAAAQALPSAPATMQSGTRINAVLKSKLDARKARVGDPVMAESTQTLKSHGNVILPKHSRLLGHVTSVSARGKSTSSMGVLFDQAVTPKGQHIPLTAGISSVLTAAGSASSAGPDAMEPMPMPAPAMMPSASAGGGLLGGVTSSVGSIAGGVTSMASASVAGGGSGSGLLRGSNGIPLRIQPVTVPAGAQGGGSLLTSDRGFVQLDRGTHIQLQTQSQSSARAATGPAHLSGNAAAQASARQN